MRSFGEAAEHELRLGADLGEVATLNAWLHRIEADHALPAELAANLKLCLNEWVANVISYGFDQTAAPALSVRLGIDGGELRAEVRDNGAPFDPLSVPEARPMTSLETAGIGGYGIKLMRESATTLHYARTNGENVVTMTFRPPG